MTLVQVADSMTEFHLLVEPLTSDDRGTRKQSPFSSVPVPRHAARLSVDPLRGHTLVHLNSENLDKSIVLESVTMGPRPVLVMLCPEAGQVRVNGQIASRVVLLREKDQFQVQSAPFVFHVTFYHRSRLGPAPPELAGKECPVCRGEIEQNTTVYTCPCGAVIHCIGEEKPPEERLECLKLSTDCPVCGMSVVLTRGYSYVPEF
jgi:hypothetical protein